MHKFLKNLNITEQFIYGWLKITPVTIIGVDNRIILHIDEKTYMNLLGFFELQLIEAIKRAIAYKRYTIVAIMTYLK